MIYSFVYGVITQLFCKTSEIVQSAKRTALTSSQGLIAN